VVSLASLFCGPLCAQLPAAAGAEMSGHRGQPATSSPTK
jgi:hypothetical protein